MKRQTTSTWWFRICSDTKNVQLDAKIPRRWLFLLVVASAINWAPNLWTAVRTALNVVR
jgi:hypothetical protein